MAEGIQSDAPSSSKQAKPGQQGKAAVTMQANEEIPDLSDPLFMGESLGALATRMQQLAPIHCTDCGGQHVKWVRHRIENDRVSFYTYFPEFVGAIFAALELLHRRGNDRLSIMIAGCADTGLLALCAHVASLQHLFPPASVHFHLVDQCRTPLILCEEFAQRHGLAVTTRHCRIPDVEPGLAANIILGSSILRFFPPERQPQVMEYLAAAQDPGGIFVYGHMLARVPAPTARPGNTDNHAQIHATIAAAGYEFDQETITDRFLRLRSGEPRQMRWYVAVATKA